jgi:hypothetical protein
LASETYFWWRDTPCVSQTEQAAATDRLAAGEAPPPPHEVNAMPTRAAASTGAKPVGLTDRRSLLRVPACERMFHLALICAVHRRDRTPPTTWGNGRCDTIITRRNGSNGCSARTRFNDAERCDRGSSGRTAHPRVSLSPPESLRSHTPQRPCAERRPRGRPVPAGSPSGPCAVVGRGPSVRRASSGFAVGRLRAGMLSATPMTGPAFVTAASARFQP